MKLKQSGNGCYMNDCYVGCRFYADDILLLSHSLSGMQHMLDICSSESIELDLKFNVKKSMAMRIGQRYKKWCAPLILNKEDLQYNDEVNI